MDNHATCCCWHQESRIKLVAQYNWRSILQSLNYLFLQPWFPRNWYGNNKPQDKFWWKKQFSTFKNWILKDARKSQRWALQSRTQHSKIIHNWWKTHAAFDRCMSLSKIDFWILHLSKIACNLESCTQHSIVASDFWKMHETLKRKITALNKITSTHNLSLQLCVFSLYVCVGVWVCGLMHNLGLVFYLARWSAMSFLHIKYEHIIRIKIKTLIQPVEILPIKNILT